MSDHERTAATAPPRAVPGYAEARAARRVPVIGSAPPAVLPGLSTLQRAAALLATFVVLLVLAAVITSVVPASPATRVLVPVVMIGGFAVLVLEARSVQRRLYAELQQGYTTFSMQFGFASAARRRERPRDAGRLVWDYRGTWVLRSNGAVRSAPDPSLDAPGFYPSPDGAGTFELWTGRSWSGRRWSP